MTTNTWLLLLFGISRQSTAFSFVPDTVFRPTWSDSCFSKSTLTTTATTAYWRLAATTTTTTDTETTSPGSWWEFRGHRVYTDVSLPKTGLDPNNKVSVILVHGFGCSSFIWRETTRSLTDAGYTVHAVDLLGQGRSAKPGRDDDPPIAYSIDLWAELIDRYAAARIPSEDAIVVMGNSLGSNVALSVATGDFEESDGSSSNVAPRCRGVGLYNCGVGMNSRNLLKDPSLNGLQRVIFTALFDFLDALVFNNIPLLNYALKNVVTKELLRNALVGLYKCSPDPASRVDDALVDSFYNPAQDEGAVQALNQIYTNDGGDTPMQVYERHAQFLGTERVPIHVIWGNSDNVTPLVGPVGQFFEDLSRDSATAVSMDIIEAGHIPFDEVPECNESMVAWMNRVVMKK